MSGLIYLRSNTVSMDAHGHYCFCSTAFAANVHQKVGCGISAVGFEKNHKTSELDGAELSEPKIQTRLCHFAPSSSTLNLDPLIIVGNFSKRIVLEMPREMIIGGGGLAIVGVRPIA